MYINIADALRYVRKVFQNQWEPHPNYNGNPRLLVFLTDGKPTKKYEPCKEVEATQAVVGLDKILVVGMGDGWTTSSIKCIVTPGYSEAVGAVNVEPDYGRIINVTTWADGLFSIFL